MMPRRTTYALALALFLSLAVPQVAPHAWHLVQTARLERGLRSPDRAERCIAIVDAPEYGPEWMPELVRILREDDDPLMRMNAAHALGRFEQPSAEAMAALADATHEGSRCAMPAALQALSTLGPAAVEAVPAIAAHLDDSSAPLRALALSTLARVRGEAAVPDLLRYLRDESPLVRTTAISRLRDVGWQRGTVELAVKACLADESPEVRDRAARALGLPDARPVWRTPPIAPTASRDPRAG